MSSRIVKHWLLSFSLLTLLVLFPRASADFGFLGTAGAFIYIDAGAGPEAYRLTPSPGGVDPFQNHNFNDDSLDGAFNYTTNPLIMSDFVVTTFEDPGDDVVGVTLYWRQYVLGESPGVFRTNTLEQVADLGGGQEQYGLGRSINLTSPPEGNLSGLVVLELFAVAESEGGGTKVLEGRDGTNPFTAYYSGWAVPEPQTLGLIGLGAVTLRLMVLRRRKQDAGLSLPSGPDDHDRA